MGKNKVVVLVDGVGELHGRTVQEVMLVVFTVVTLLRWIRICSLDKLMQDAGIPVGDVAMPEFEKMGWP